MVVGFSPVKPMDARQEELAISGFENFHVLVTIPASEAFAPVRRITWFVAGVGSLIVGGFLLAGFYLASRKIIAPIESLRALAENVEAAAGNPKEARALAARLPEELGKITSNDELGDLAASMGSMAKRVLGYQGRLEREISAKTAEMRRDLQFARDFQRSLMPHEYPVLPLSSSGLRVRFHHVYQPASSVGGDYFDLLRLSNSRVGVFVADVMGHGARSALVTAILATLMQDYEKEAHNPAELLRMLNSHFYDLISGGEEVLFVTAIHLVVDVANDRIEWASAGHPSPLVANRETGSTAPLFEDLSHNPALGIFPDSTYDLNHRAIKGGEVFFMFTDGVIEAADERGNEFGRQRVCKIIEENLDRPVQEINEAVYKEIVSCQTGASAQDDICLVAIDLAREAHTAQVKG